MKVLIACEESQAVCKEFRKLGHEAYSCDILPCSGGHPEWHIMDDVLEILNGDCFFWTESESCHHIKQWDLMIAHPTCTFLTNSGVTWLHKDAKRWLKLFEAADFFLKLLNAPIEKKSLENPIMHKYAKRLIGVNQSQIIQPHMFGHLEQKATCLWNVNLPNLIPTNNVKEEMLKLPKNQQQRLHYLPPSKDRAKLRSKTFSGIAKAIAEQWGV